MSDSLPVDLAILLPAETGRAATDLNRLLLERHPNGYPLDDTHLPHITLIQQFVQTAAIDRLSGVVESFLSEFSPMSLRAEGPGKGGSTVHVRIAEMESLEALHRRAHASLGAFAASGGHAVSFFSAGMPARPGDAEWIVASLENFNPHITLGVGELVDLDAVGPLAPWLFDVDRVALCHVGAHGTCRRILREWRLTE